LPTSTRLLVPESVQDGPYKLKERKAKQIYYYNKGARELDRLKPGDVVHVKLGLDSKEWSKAAVGKEVNIRLYQVHTEDGLTFGRNQTNQRAIFQKKIRVSH